MAVDLSKLIGNTPSVRLNSASNKYGVEIYGKLECLNPAGSIKDRVALSIIDDAKNQGKIADGCTMIAPTSGNTGLAVALICAIRGYNAIITMPDTMSIERRNILRAYGAKVVLTPGNLGMRGALDCANELKNDIDNSFIVDQFDNPSTVLAHQKTTAVEIWESTNGQLDAVVCGVGTGGTLTGIGRFLKAKRPDIKMVAVEPANSAVLSGGTVGPHGLQGIGAGFIPSILDLNLIDTVVKIEDEEAYSACRELSEQEGIFVGISSGAAFCGAAKYIEDSKDKLKRIVIIFPDGGQKYLSQNIWGHVE